MFSKALELAILTLQAQDPATNDPAAGTTTDNNSTTGGSSIVDQAQQDFAFYSSFVVQFAAFVYLGLGLAITFFGAKFVQVFISLLFGLIAGAIPLVIGGTGSVSTGLTVAAVCLFLIVSFGCWHAHKFQAILLGVGIGTYVGSVAYGLLSLVAVIPNWVKFLMEAICAAAIGHYGQHHAKDFMVHSTAFLGSNMIFTSITLFAADQLGGFNFLLQLACIIVFSIAGHHV